MCAAHTHTTTTTAYKPHLHIIIIIHPVKDSCRKITMLLVYRIPIRKGKEEKKKRRFSPESPAGFPRRPMSTRDNARVCMCKCIWQFRAREFLEPGEKSQIHRGRRLKRRNRSGGVKNNVFNIIPVVRIIRETRRSVRRACGRIYVRFYINIYR